jgi:hypothetical protein
MKVTLGQYYKGFKSLYAIAASIPFLPPLLHIVVPDSNTFAQYLCPPLGDVQQLASTFTLIFLLLTTLVVFDCCRFARRRHPSISALLTVAAMLGVVALIALYSLYVKDIPIRSTNVNVLVSVGYERTDFALKTYPYPLWTEYTMLHDTGPQEEKIQLLWTRKSIWIVRVLLWAAYTLALVCCLSVVSLMVYQHALEKRRCDLEGRLGD